MRAEDEALIVACIPSLRRYARGLVANREQADDLVQDTLERAWQKYSRWQKRGELRAWMFGIMHNHFIDGLRSQKRQVEYDAHAELPDLPVPAPQTDGLAVRDVIRCIQQLPLEYRQVLLLVAIEAFSYREAARVLDVPVGTVMSRLARARERLSLLLAQSTQADAPPAVRLQSVK